jgi:hypothetical protein
MKMRANRAARADAALLIAAREHATTSRHVEGCDRLDHPPATSHCDGEPFVLPGARLATNRPRS